MLEAESKGEVWQLQRPSLRRRRKKRDRVAFHKAPPPCRRLDYRTAANFLNAPQRLFPVKTIACRDGVCGTAKKRVYHKPPLPLNRRLRFLANILDNGLAAIVPYLLRGELNHSSRKLIAAQKATRCVNVPLWESDVEEGSHHRDAKLVF